MDLEKLKNILRQVYPFNPYPAKEQHSDSDNPTSIVWGFSGGSTQGPVLLGAAKALNEHGIYPTQGYGKSIGAVAIAAYFGLLEQYKNNPSRFEQYPSGPAQELEERILTRDPLLKFFSKWSIANKKGFVDTTPIDDLLAEILGEKTFRDFPSHDGSGSALKIVAHKAGSQEDITFGDVGLNNKIIDIVRHSISIAGVIEAKPYDGEDITNVLKKGDLLLDGGILRISPLRELYAKEHDLRVLVYLGFHSGHSGLDSIMNGEKKNVRWSRPVKKVTEDLIEKLSMDYEIARSGASDREWHDLEEDTKTCTGMTVKEAMECMDPEFLMIAPKYKHVRFNSSYPTKELIEAGYRGAIDTLRLHQKIHGKLK